MCNELGGLASTTMGVDMELKVEASLREARTLLAAKQYSQVCSKSLLTICFVFKELCFVSVSSFYFVTMFSTGSKCGTLPLLYVPQIQFANRKGLCSSSACRDP